MGVSLDLDISDGTEEPDNGISLGRHFYDNIINNYSLLGQIPNLSTIDKKVISPNEYGKIYINSSENIKNKEAYLILLQRMIKGEVGYQQYDQFLIDEGILSIKIKDRERNPKQLKRALKLVDRFLENQNLNDSYRSEFEQIYKLLEKAIKSNNKILWEYFP